MGSKGTLIISVLAILGGINAYITWIAIRLPLEGFVAAPGAPWPMPAGWVNYSTLRTINPNTFTFASDVIGCDVIDAAIQRYSALINLDPAGQPDPGLSPVTMLDIYVENKTCSPTYYPYVGMDESYSLDVFESSSVLLSANSIWGALRGLETFSQLIYLTDNKLYQLNWTSITDSPRFHYRGLMIDTARHFMKMPILMKILDAMSWDKFNVLHWHVVDDQSFPYPSRIFPDLPDKGAYTPNHRYSRDDVNTLLSEARLRGITVIPEFDTPGHTYSWGLSYPELITPCWGQGLDGGPGVPDYPRHGANEVMNPMEEFTFEFLDDFYQEVVEDFPDRFVHLGMDEAYHACWESNPNMTQWMLSKNFTSYMEVEQYFSTRLIEIVENKGADYIIWQDPIDQGVKVNPNTLVEVWKESVWQDYLLNIASQGYKTLLSAPWYLNYISYGQDWRDYYNAEPHNFTSNSTLWDSVQGGEACIWAEYVDGTNILSRLWPRLSAVAERLWSPKTETDVESAKFRLDQQRCRFVRRGLPAQPILNGYCGDYEWDFENGNVHQVSMGQVSSSAGFYMIIISLLVASFFGYN